MGVSNIHQKYDPFREQGFGQWESSRAKHEALAVSRAARQAQESETGSFKQSESRVSREPERGRAAGSPGTLRGEQVTNNIAELRKPAKP